MHIAFVIPFLAAMAAAMPSQPKVTPSPLANNKRGLSQITVTMVNSMSVAISTSIASNAGTGLASGAESPTGTMAAGASASIVAPQGWAGNMAVGLANYSAMYMPSLMEAALTDFGAGYMFDIDVSYVNGYTVPITCHCNDDKSFLSGCNVDLWSNHTCGAGGETYNTANGVCVNPTNEASGAAKNSSLFFSPCQGKAYTYPSDDDANSEGKCTSGSATCCVGTAANGCPGAS